MGQQPSLSVFPHTGLCQDVLFLAPALASRVVLMCVLWFSVVPALLLLFIRLVKVYLHILLECLGTGCTGPTFIHSSFPVFSTLFSGTLPLSKHGRSKMPFLSGVVLTFIILVFVEPFLFPNMLDHKCLFILH